MQRNLPRRWFGAGGEIPLINAKAVLLYGRARCRAASRQVGKTARLQTPAEQIDPQAAPRTCRFARMQVRLEAAKWSLGVAPEMARKVIQNIYDSKWYPQAGDAGMTLWNLDRGVFKPDKIATLSPDGGSTFGFGILQ